jgi:hypothetical protein
MKRCYAAQNARPLREGLLGAEVEREQPMCIRGQNTTGRGYLASIRNDKEGQCGRSGTPISSLLHLCHRASAVHLPGYLSSEPDPLPGLPSSYL